MSIDRNDLIILSAATLLGVAGYFTSNLIFVFISGILFGSFAFKFGYLWEDGIR